MINAQSNSAIHNNQALPVLKPLLAGIPKELASLDNWILWKKGVVKTDGSGRWGKLPVDIRGYNINAHDVSKHNTLAMTYSFYESGSKKGLCHGIAIDLPNNPEPISKNSLGVPLYLIGIDIDDCVNSNDEVSETVQNDIKLLGDVYTELSPSGTGIRVFVLYPKPLKGGNKDGREMYSGGRFLTVTGQGTGGIREVGVELEQLEENWFRTKNLQLPISLINTIQTTHNLTSNQFTPPNKVKDGEGRESTILQYAGSLRLKGLNQDAIEAVLLSYNQTHIDPPLDETVVLDKARRYESATNPEIIHHNFNTILDLTKARPNILTKPPPKRDYVLDGLLVRGKPAVLAGMGGTSKTQFTIQLAACHALGKSFMGMHLTQGSSMLLLGEEDKPEIDRRLNAYMVAESMTQIEKQRISERVAAFGMVGQDIRLTKLQGSNAETTNFVDGVIETAKEHSRKSGSPVSLIVIDHARLAAGGDLNDAAHVTCFTRDISRLADETNASVMVLAHSPKSAAGRDEPSALDVAGSSALVDNARAAFMMGKPSLVEAKRLHIPNEDRSKFVVFTVVKNNYGKSDVQIVMHKTESIDYQVGLLELADLTAFQIAAQKPVKTTVCDSLLAKIKSFNGALSKTKAAERYSRELNMPRREAEAAIDQMIIEGKMEVRSPSPEEKKQWGLSGNVRQVLGVIESCT